MTEEVKNPSDPLVGPSSWVFYRPEWVSIGKKIFFKSFNITYVLLESLLKTEQILIKELGLKMDW